MSKSAGRLAHADFFRALEKTAEFASPSRVEVMNNILDFVGVAYFLAINPLSQLRSIFPQYTWKYHKLETHAQAREVVAKVDFIWMANSSSPLDVEVVGFELITATAVSPRRPLRVFFADIKKDSERTRMIELAESLGGKPEYFHT